MNVIYLSSCCSEKKFSELREQGITKKMPQAQKYHRLLIEGISQVIDGTVTVISAIPTNRKWSKKVFFKREEETLNNVKFIYDSFINLPFLRWSTRCSGAKKIIGEMYRNNRDVVIICDVLNLSLAKAARECGKKYGIPVIGIVTDVPGHTSEARIKSENFVRRLLSKIATSKAKKDIAKYDAYLLLTEDMAEVIGVKDKPYIVIEGHCDEKMQLSDNRIEEKSSPKTVMYAGGIHTEFGIGRFVEAFLRGNFENWELHIYGDGNYQSDLKQITKTHTNVKYFGMVDNSIIVSEQLKASLLVNPRLTDAEYVRYSFPSKTMECMASGTPLLTTRLPGMPKEYYDYVYFIDDETVEGMLEALHSTLSIEATEMHAMGLRSKQFVLNNKNNVVQAKKLVEFIMNIQAGG